MTKNILIFTVIFSTLFFSCGGNQSSKDAEPKEEKKVQSNRKDTGLIRQAKDSAMARKMDASHALFRQALVAKNYQKIKADVFDLISLTYALEKKYTDAANYIDSAIAFAPDSGKYYYHRFLLYQKDSNLIGDDCADLMKAKTLGVTDTDLNQSITEFGCK